MRTIVIYSGRFQFFHPGHKQVYDHFVNKYGAENVYIVTSNSQNTKNSPFSFEEKANMMVASGVPRNSIVQVKSPYVPKELTSKLDLENVQILFPLGDDDRKRFSPYYIKKDGSLSYLQPYKGNENNIQPASVHSYIFPLPRFEYKINGKVMNSGTELRNTYMASNDSGRLEILNQLYGKNGQKLKRIIDKGLGSLIESLIKPMREFTKFIFGF